MKPSTNKLKAAPALPGGRPRCKPIDDSGPHKTGEPLLWITSSLVDNVAMLADMSLTRIQSAQASAFRPGIADPIVSGRAAARTVGIGGQICGYEGK